MHFAYHYRRGLCSNNSDVTGDGAAAVIKTREFNTVHFYGARPQRSTYGDCGVPKQNLGPVFPQQINLPLI